MNWIQFKRSRQSHVSRWHSDSILVSYKRGGWVVGSRIFTVTTKHLGKTQLDIKLAKRETLSVNSCRNQREKNPSEDLISSFFWVN